MKDIVFTLRMSPQIAQRLTALAENSERSKAGVLRWLIHNAHQQQLMRDGDLTLPAQRTDIGIKKNLTYKEK